MKKKIENLISKEWKNLSVEQLEELIDIKSLIKNIKDKNYRTRLIWPENK